MQLFNILYEIIHSYVPLFKYWNLSPSATAPNVLLYPPFTAGAVSTAHVFHEVGHVLAGDSVQPCDEDTSSSHWITWV